MTTTLPRPAAAATGSANALYRAVWRWHLHTGFIVAPSRPAVI